MQAKDEGRTGSTPSTNGEATEGGTSATERAIKQLLEGLNMSRTYKKRPLGSPTFLSTVTLHYYCHAHTLGCKNVMIDMTILAKLVMV